MNVITDFIKRHLLYIVIAVVCMFALSYIASIPAMIKVLLQMPLIIGVVIILSSVTLYSYTPIDFVGTTDADKKDGHNYSVIVAAHIAGKYRVMAAVFTSVSLLTAITLLAIYFLTN